MDICFVPSLEHLACSKIIISLLDDPNIDLRWVVLEETHNRNTLRLKEIISTLSSCNRLKAKLESFIKPILCEVENWAEFCLDNWTTLSDIPLTVNDTVRQCWLSDGSIDPEKSAKILVKRSDISPIIRITFACNFCMFHDILDLWSILSKIEKAYLRHTCYSRRNKSGFIVKQWREWLDTSANHDWESFVEYTLQNASWRSNVYVMKRIFQTSGLVVRGHHLLEALDGWKVKNDVKRFGLMIMSRDEREEFFKESPIEVFKCILSWPLRNVFFHLADNLWPYITTRIYCGILDAILRMIKNERRDYIDFLVILKNFWLQSPSHCKKAAEEDSSITRPLNFVLKYDSAKQFSRKDFLNSFRPECNESAVEPFRLLLELPTTSFSRESSR